VVTAALEAMFLASAAVLAWWNDYLGFLTCAQEGTRPS
jgi:hypothetical protein